MLSILVALDAHAFVEYFAHPRCAELLQRADVAFRDFVRANISGNRSRQFRFSQEVEDRVGRAVGVVLGCVRLGAGELIVRMQAGHLEFALVSRFFDQAIDHAEKVVVVEEVVQYGGMDQHGGLDFPGIRRAQQFQFPLHLCQQVFRLICGAHHIAHLPALVGFAGERADVQFDHHALDPAAGAGNDSFVACLIFHGRIIAVMASRPRALIGNPG